MGVEPLAVVSRLFGTSYQLHYVVLASFHFFDDSAEPKFVMTRFAPLGGLIGFVQIAAQMILDSVMFEPFRLPLLLLPPCLGFSDYGRGTIADTDSLE